MENRNTRIENIARSAVANAVKATMKEFMGIITPKRTARRGRKPGTAKTATTKKTPDAKTAKAATSKKDEYKLS